MHPASWAFDPFAFSVGDRTSLGSSGVVSIGVEGVGPARVAVGADSAAAERWNLIVVGAIAEGTV